MSSNKYARSLTLLLLTLSWTLIRPANSLNCSCNVCLHDHCLAKPDGESMCYKSVELIRNKNGSYTLDASYGCLSGGDSLSHLQCHTRLPKSEDTEPIFIKCCKNEDFCNDNLPDPTELDDSRWGTLEQPVDTTNRTNYLPTIDFWPTILLSSAGIASIFLLIKCCSRSTKDSRGSTSSLKADLDKFHVAVSAAGSSSISTHSYSISDDLCHKTPEPTQYNDDSFMPEDLTSGLGERMLNERTMARTIGFGKTDHVGNGRFGRVFRGEYHGEDVAVKAFRTIDQDSWKREDTIFRTLNHDNIVRFIASEVTSVENTTTEIWMFLEYCPFGSLCDYLDHHEVIGPNQAVKILHSIINGLNYLHEDYAQASRLYKPSIAHRDIKSKNILMKTPDSCCIADFGHALIKVNEETLDYGKYQHLQVGTIRYMAPEILRPNTALDYRHFSTFAQADLYQYGLILWEVCHRTALDVLHPAGHHQLPYDGVVPQNPDIQDMIKIVCDDQYRPPRYDKWDKYPYMKCLADLMVECWRPNPKARMETLGVKKKLKRMYDDVMYNQNPSHIPYHYSTHNNFSLSPSFRNDRDKTKSYDVNSCR